jgi:DNA invertase Pin-like site-specific DNA recombinase
VDRIERSLKDLLAFLGDDHAANIDVYVRKEGLDTTSPTGKAAFSLMGLFAEFERDLIRQRVLAGLARAKAQGRVLGRPRMPCAYQKLYPTILMMKSAKDRPSGHLGRWAGESLSRDRCVRRSL